MERVPYASAVSSLMYAMMCTRLDIFTDGQCYQYVHGESEKDTLESSEMGPEVREGTHGAPVSWRSILHARIILSTIEVEYMAMAEGVKEALWLWGLLDDLVVEQDDVNL
ncbi:uncharacterized protein LOC109821799 [Asparagus officinalis]|uniref:uncharacterized protein LOC109821799 n=1 Tax=Asparagus officinalis TaxID=4686 RepID=UPI00098E4D2E|nr:uncharacterized protein LOC109821799 [Asparagus officinalis]